MRSRVAWQVAESCQDGGLIPAPLYRPRGVAWDVKESPAEKANEAFRLTVARPESKFHSLPQSAGQPARLGLESVYPRPRRKASSGAVAIQISQRNQPGACSASNRGY